MNAPRNRRQFLRTSTALIALPMLESFGLGRLAAASPRDVPAPRPKRMIFLGFGWGVTQQSWYPAMEDKGAGYALPSGLAPLARQARDELEEIIAEQIAAVADAEVITGVRPSYFEALTAAAANPIEP